MIKKVGLIALSIYLLLVTLGVAHAFTPHKCKQRGEQKHSCNHVSQNGKQNKQDHVSLLKTVAREATFHQVAFQDDASVPTDCICYISCFLSGDGLPSPFDE